MNRPVCSSEWERIIQGKGSSAESNFLFNVFVMVEEDPERYQLLSVRKSMTSTTQMDNLRKSPSERMRVVGACWSLV